MSLLDQNPKKGQYLGVFFLAFAALAFELLLTRLLSYRYWYHYASLIIAIAMLGNGIAGTFSSFFRKGIKETRYVVFFLALLFALAIPFMIQLSNQVDFVPHLYQLSDQQTSPGNGNQGVIKTIGTALKESLSGIRLQEKNVQEQLKLYFLFMFPFLLVGIVLTFVFSAYQSQISRFYFADLAGAGLGVLAVLLFLPYLGLEKMFWLVGAIGGLSALFFSSALPRIWMVLPLISIGFLILPLISLRSHGIDIPTTKVDKRHVQVFAEYWDNVARISLWRKNDNYITINMDWSCLTIVQNHSKGLATRKKLYENHYIPFLLRPDGVSCIVGAGGGRDVNAHLDMHELYGNPQKKVHTFAVELNPSMIRILRSTNIFRIPGVSWSKTNWNQNVTNMLAFSGNLAKHPDVSLVNDEGRNFIRSRGLKYDLIVQNNAYTFSAVSSGAFSLAENYLMTVEAFEEYFDHLNDGGILYFSRPYFESIRIASVAREFFRRRGMSEEFSASIAIFLNPDQRGYNVQQFYLKKGRFTRNEISLLEQEYRLQAKRDGFSDDVVVYAPFLVPEKWPGSSIDIKSQTLLNNTQHMRSLILAPDQKSLEEVYSGSLTDIRPSTDDWPFFSQRAKFKDFIANGSPALKKIESFFPQSIMSIKQALSVVALISVLLILVPVFFLRQSGLDGIGGSGLSGIVGKIQFLSFFAMIGLGFMFIEIHLMQKLGLVFGTPIRAIALVLAGTLVFSGCGSYLTSFIPDKKKSLLIALALVILMVAIYLPLGKPLLRHVMGEPFFLRVLVSMVFIIPLSLGMGMMFPSAVGWISEHYPRAVAWGWAVNGFFSVIASLLANIMAVFLGLSSLMVCAVIFYTIGVLFFVLLQPKNKPSEGEAHA